jgi:hypothetical protein
MNQNIKYAAVAAGSGILAKAISMNPINNLILLAGASVGGCITYKISRSITYSTAAAGTGALMSGLANKIYTQGFHSVLNEASSLALSGVDFVKKNPEPFLGATFGSGGLYILSLFDPSLKPSYKIVIATASGGAFIASMPALVPYILPLVKLNPIASMTLLGITLGARGITLLMPVQYEIGKLRGIGALILGTTSATGTAMYSYWPEISNGIGSLANKIKNFATEHPIVSTSLAGIIIGAVGGSLPMIPMNYKIGALVGGAASGTGTAMYSYWPEISNGIGSLANNAKNFVADHPIAFMILAGTAVGTSVGAFPASIINYKTGALVGAATSVVSTTIYTYRNEVLDHACALADASKDLVLHNTTLCVLIALPALVPFGYLGHGQIAQEVVVGEIPDRQQVVVDEIPDRQQVVVGAIPNHQEAAG